MSDAAAPRVIVVGGGGHAGVLVSIARRDRLARLAGYVDRQDRGPRHGLAWLGGDDAPARDHPGCTLLFGLGFVRDGEARWAVYARHRAAGAACIVLVSGRAAVAAEAQLGAGTVVLDVAVVGPGARLGEACIVNSGAVVEHDARLGDNVHVAPHATLCGDVQVGDHVLVGAGATVVPGVRIASGVVVGAGAVVTRDLARAGVYVGAPARLAEPGRRA